MSLTDHNAREMLLSLAMMHGIHKEVEAMLKDCPELPDVTLAKMACEQRKATGMSHSKLAKRGGLARSTIGHLEADDMDAMGAATLQAVSYAYRIPFIRAVLGQLYREDIFCAPGAQGSAPGCE